MKFFIYGRKSVYTGKGESIENQIEMCRNYIASKFPDAADMHIYTYEDEGFSAKNTERPQFKRMMRDVRTLEPDYIICYRLDRISRNVSDFSALIEELNRRGISFVCIKEEFDTSKPMGKAMMYIASVFAQLERETIAERVRDNMMMLARTGRWLGGTPPTGYISGKMHEIIWDGKIKNYCILQENPEELKTVHFIFDAFQTHRSLSGVCTILKQHKTVSRSGKHFTPPVIKQILKNPVYCTADEDSLKYFTEEGAEVCFNEQDFKGAYGLIAYNKRDYKRVNTPRREISDWIVAAGKHRGLICGKEWVAIQHLFHAGTVKPHNDYSLLSGMLFCGQCGAAMYPKRRTSSDSYDYMCSEKLRKGKTQCNCRNLNGPDADAAVLSYMIDAAGCEGDICRGLEKLKHSFGMDEACINYYEKEIASCTNEIKGLVRLIGGNPESSFVLHIQDRIKELEDKIGEMTAQSETLQTKSQSEEVRETAATAARALLHPEQYIPRLSVGEKRRLTEILLKKAVWDGKTLHLYP